MSPIALLKRFAPLRDYLSARIGRPVVLQTAKNYPEFILRSGKRHYDILLTAPHFTLLALDSGAYTVRATYRKPLAAVILVRRDSPFRSPLDLAGKVIAIPPPEAFLAIVGRHLLAQQGLTGARAPLYRNYLSHNAAYHAVVGGEADAAITTIYILKNASNGKPRLRVLTRSADFPALGILTAKDLPRKLQRRIAAALVEMNDNDAGRRVLKRIAYPGYRYARAREFAPLRPYLTDPGFDVSTKDPAH